LVTCAASDQCHAAGSCDAATGVCPNPLKTGSCDDGNKCTQTDTCQAGACVGDNPVVCAASDQCHGIGSCDAKTGACSNPSKADGSSCDDADKCTQSDSCQGGKCTGDKPVKCPALGQCYAAGACDSKTGLCSSPFAASGTACNDANACTASETCDGKGNCGGGSAVVCTAPSACQTNVCNSSLGCQPGNQPNGTACDDGSQCTQTDLCRSGSCVGTDKLTNARGDWSDDPGTVPVAGKPWTSVGPRSVDVFTDKAGRVHAVGTYSGAIAFNDKDDASGNYKSLALPTSQLTGIYWAIYSEAGALVQVANLGGVARGGTLTVVSAAGNVDGSFTLLGTFSGNGQFGLNGKTKNVADKSLEVFIAHYAASGEIEWVAQGVPSGSSTFAANSVANFDDGAVIAVGASDGPMTFIDASGATFGSVEKPGVWAVRLDAKGAKQWARTEVLPDSSAAAQAVTTHEDGSASLTGGFTGKAALGPRAELAISVAAGEKGRDIWFEKLDVKGELLWGGRVGGDGADVPGDVARVKGGGLLLLGNTVGGEPSADDAKTTQPLFATASTSTQAHVLLLDADGVLQSDGLIAAPSSGATRGYQLDLDARGFYAVAGTFAATTSFWGDLGFGSGKPASSADLSVKSAMARPGPLTLFLARVNVKTAFDWGVQAGGDFSGMTTAPWNVVLTGQPSHSATVAGIFNANAIFGDQVTETLAGAPDTVGNAFIVHLNSEAEYDYCK